MFPFFRKTTSFLEQQKSTLDEVGLIKLLAHRGDVLVRLRFCSSVSENNNRKTKPSEMKIGEDALLFSKRGLTFERTAQAEPDSLATISLQTEVSQPNVNSEERKCVNNICSRVQIQTEPVTFT